MINSDILKVFFSTLLFFFTGLGIGCQSSGSLISFVPGAADVPGEELDQAQMARRAEGLRMLSSGDSEVRERAAIELLSMGDKRSLQAIENKLKGSTQPEIKVDILRAIAFRTDRRCFDFILEALTAPHPEVREAAAKALANFSRPEEIEAVKRYATSPERSSQDLKMIYETMGAGIFVDATPLLIEGLRAEEEEIRLTAWESLRSIWDRNISPSPEKWEELWAINKHRKRDEILEERLRASEITLSSLRRELRDMEVEFEEFSAFVMSEKHNNPKELLAALAGNNKKLIEYAAFALNEISSDKLKELSLDDRDTYLKLRNSLRGNSSKVTQNIAELLPKLEGEHLDDLLLEALHLEDSPHILNAAIKAIKETPQEKIVSKLEELLFHFNPKVRENAANVLGRSTKESSVAALRNALKDEEANVRWFAVESLRKMEAVEAVQDLTELLEEDPSPLVREIAATTLAQFAQPASFSSLRRALADESRRVREQAAKALIILAQNNPERTSTIGEELVKNELWDHSKDLLELAQNMSEEMEAPEELKEQIINLRLTLADGLSKHGDHSQAAEIYLKLLRDNGEFQTEARQKLITSYIETADTESLKSVFKQWLETEDESDLQYLMEKGIATVKKLQDNDMNEEAAELTGILTNRAQEASMPDDLLDKLKSFGDSSGNDNSSVDDKNDASIQ